jgi:phosphoribosyl 1,2-cyclic phosphodiesterase
LTVRFATLGSGSRGNAVLVEGGGNRVLIDCGFAAREAERRLKRLGADASDLDAILVTHEHGDHVRGVAALARRHRIPVWSTPGTWRRVKGQAPEGLRLFSGHGAGFGVGDLRVEPFPVPHDAREPCQFVLESEGRRLGLLTDTGTVTRHIRDLLRDCDAMMLECNHDTAMLRTGPYPPALRERVGGAFGHLSNDQAAELIDALPHRNLSSLLVAHVSEKNNRPELARSALLEVDADLASRIQLACQDRPSDWLTV